uniref:MADS-box protein 10 n=1 Tax=Cunninghamia lanceolata TaxID=28977 RepID=A0A8F3BY94_CUNLA|nr:MADS-box protein 10 [Cunninghamia lanceolata]
MFCKVVAAHTKFKKKLQLIQIVPLFYPIIYPQISFIIIRVVQFNFVPTPSYATCEKPTQPSVSTRFTCQTVITEKRRHSVTNVQTLILCYLIRVKKNRMVRGKVHLKKIQNTVNRRVTFSKRKAGLLKKASELSVLCEAEIGLIIFSPTGKLYDFASPSMSRIAGRYQKFGASTRHHIPLLEDLETLHLEVENMQKTITHLEKTYKHMNGEDLNLLSFKELKCLERKISLGARKIRSRKDKISQEYIQSLKMKEKSLKRENANLDKKIKSHKACHLNIDIIEGANDKLETDAATQRDLPQTNLNLNLS